MGNNGKLVTHGWSWLFQKPQRINGFHERKLVKNWQVHGMLFD
jgi:hypothetical protein